jgi:hypothetical protein
MDDVLTGAQLGLGVDDHCALLCDVVAEEDANATNRVVHTGLVQATGTRRAQQAR